MSSSNSNKGRVLKRADPSTIQDKFLVGYQGWFTCPGDGEPISSGHHGWLHWFNSPIENGGRPNTDLWPDVSTYSPSELYPAPGLSMSDGTQALLFSSRNRKTVQRHFHWMAEHGVDGAFLQRFLGQCDLEAGNEGIMRIRDEVGDRVKESAESEGRVFAIMYDVSGVPSDRVLRLIQRDWIHLIRDKDILDSPNYLKEKGKPVIALWGFGFDNAHHTPNLVRSVTTFLRNCTPGGAYIMGGVPASWRTADNDADRNPDFLNVWLNEFDAISPWTVGRFRTQQEADNFAATKLKGDVELIKKRNEEGASRKVDYIPVVFPGGSGYHLSEGKWAFNEIKRAGGRFLWQQIANARKYGVRVMYGAMWDEYDEGTAFLPVVPNKRLLPNSDRWRFLALDEDGYDLPTDWYMRICGFAAEGLRSERRIFDTFPSKELQDYWSTRPRYEDVNHKSGDFVSGSSKGAEGAGGPVEGSGQSYQEWLAAQKEDKDEPPPPPYSLEVDEAQVQSQAAATPQSPTAGTSLSAAPVTATSATTASEVTHKTASATTFSNISSSTSSAPATEDTAHNQQVQNNPLGQSSSRQSSYSQQNYTSSEGFSPNFFDNSNTSYYNDPLHSLTNDFGRHNISSPVPTSGSGNFNSISPPPLHPAHPAANVDPARPNSRPQSRPGSHSRHGSQSRPDIHNHGSSLPPQEPHSPGQWSSAQWPPSEWKLNPSQNPQQRPFSSQGMAHPHGGTSPVSVGASLRPHASLGPSSARPTTPGASPHHGPSPSTYIPPATGSSTYTPGGFAFPSASTPSMVPDAHHVFPPVSNTSSHASGSSYRPSYLTPGESPYNPAPSIAFPGQSWSDGPPPHNPSSGPVGGSSYHGQRPSQPYSPVQGSLMPGASYTGGPSPLSHSPPFISHQIASTGAPYFPHASGGEESSYFNNGPPQSLSYQSSSYPGHHDYPSSYQGASFPQASAPSVPDGGPWMSGGVNYPAPPSTTPQHSNYSSYASPGQSFPMMGSGALGFARGAVDKVAGRRTREQLESQMGSIAHTGNKLFNKFMK